MSFRVFLGLFGRLFGSFRVFLGLFGRLFGSFWVFSGLFGSFRVFPGLLAINKCVFSGLFGINKCVFSGLFGSFRVLSGLFGSFWVLSGFFGSSRYKEVPMFRNSIYFTKLYVSLHDLGDVNWYVHGLNLRHLHLPFHHHLPLPLFKRINKT